MAGSSSKYKKASYYDPKQDALIRKPQRGMVLVIVFMLTFFGFLFVSISQATTSWTIIDNYKDFVYPDEHQGLWQTCYDKEGSECIPRESFGKLSKGKKALPLSAFNGLTYMARPSWLGLVGCQVQT